MRQVDLKVGRYESDKTPGVDVLTLTYIKNVQEDDLIDEYEPKGVDVRIAPILCSRPQP